MYIMRRVLLLPVATLLSCTPAELGEIGDELQAWVHAGEIVGGELLVMRDGETLMHQAFGWKDRESGAPLEVNSIYSLASLTKPVTALAVLMLAEEGALSLDDPVSRYIPEFRGDARATVADLLAHRSGDGGEHGDGAYNVYDFAALEDWVADWAVIEPTAEYGQFSYSNFNYAALGYIAEQASGVPFGEFVTRRILQPIGMDDTYVSFAPDSSWVDRVPTSYVWDAETGAYEVFWTPDRPQRWAFFPAAFGLWGSPADYAKFVTFWFDGGRAEGQQLVSAESIEAALAPQGFAGEEGVYGYGWFVDQARSEGGSPASFRHSGGRGTMAIGYPGDRGIVVYFTQSENAVSHQRALANRIEMSGLFRHPGPDMVWAEEAGVREAPLASAVLEESVGRYRGAVHSLDGLDWYVRVWVDGDVLRMEEGPFGSLLQIHAHLVPVGPDRFILGRYEAGELVGADPASQVRLVRAEGSVTAVELSFDGTVEYVLERVGEVQSRESERVARSGR